MIIWGCTESDTTEAMQQQQQQHDKKHSKTRIEENFFNLVNIIYKNLTDNFKLGDRLNSLLDQEQSKDIYCHHSLLFTIVLYKFSKFSFFWDKCIQACTYLKVIKISLKINECSSQMTPFMVSPPRPAYFRQACSVFLSVTALVTVIVVCLFFFPPSVLIDYGAMPSTLTSYRTFIIRVG